MNGSQASPARPGPEGLNLDGRAVAGYLIHGDEKREFEAGGSETLDTVPPSLSYLARACMQRRPESEVVVISDAPRSARRNYRPGRTFVVKDGPDSFFSIVAESDKDEDPLLSWCMSETITVRGMSCEHCEQTVEGALEGVSGVRAVVADREAETATVEGNPDIQALIDAVENAGYDAAA